ncbi:universal stress protein [Streptomyces sp. NBC_01317]|uniref:universal stress protein n=1 Tax=Streptomyces sp. NBC_01317 TaxID=2903822 RepID=UPI002E0D4095|nr:universal stress protein [Streptomyces sp. NBC_01317]
MHPSGRPPSNDRRVVVGVNGSLGSLAALHRAAAEARRTGGQLWAVLAWDPPPAEFTQHGYLPSVPLLEACRRAAGLELATALRNAFGNAGPGVPVDGLVSRGTPGRALVQIASREDDLLVVGTGHRGLLHRALFPSVARYCVAHAACPVLTVPPPPLQQELETASRRNALRLPLDARELDGGRISEV